MLMRCDIEKEPISGVKKRGKTEGGLLIFSNLYKYLSYTNGIAISSFLVTSPGSVHNT